jgi:1-acyl-sn-glycerol-3-phosphate acyltransferase
LTFSMLGPESRNQINLGQTSHVPIANGTSGLGSGQNGVWPQVTGLATEDETGAFVNNELEESRQRGLSPPRSEALAGGSRQRDCSSPRSEAPAADSDFGLSDQQLQDAQKDHEAYVMVDAEAQRWQVKQAPKKGKLEKLQMVLPALTRIPFNLFGGALAAGGYAVGKVGEAVGTGKAVDSTPFQAGFAAWMYSNGIFPSVKYEPVDERFLPSSEKDMSLTPIIIANHISYMDGGILAAEFAAPKIIAKSGARDVPILGKLMEEMETVFVDRSSQDSRQATLEAITKHCESWTPGSRALLMFPEGTTTNGESIIEFKKGAFAPGLPVRPVLLVYTGQWDPASTKYKDTSAGIRRTSDAEWSSEFLGHFVHSVHVRVLPPYMPGEDEVADCNLFARNCRAYMATELARVRDELRQQSWNEAAGRSEGGLGYTFGDLTRWGWRSTFGRSDTAALDGAASQPQTLHRN